MLPTGPVPVRLRELLPDAEVFPPASDPAATALVDDAQAVCPGEAYVELDGFDSVSPAIAVARGAAAIITERLLPDLSTPQVLVEDAWQAKRQLQASGRLTRGPASDLPTGERSTRPALIVIPNGDEAATLTATILALSGQPTALLTSRVDDDGEVCTEASTGVASAAGWLSRADRNNAAAAVCSVSGGESAELIGSTGPNDGAAVLCLLGRQRCANETPSPDASLIVAADEPTAVRVAATHPGPVLTFGNADHADVSVRVIDEHVAGQQVVVSHQGESAVIDLDRPGGRRRREAAAALAIAIARGLSLAPAVRLLEHAAEPLLRLQRVGAGLKPVVFADVATSADELRETLREADTLAEGRVIVVATLNDRAAVANAQLAVLERMADRSFVVGAPESLEFVDPRVTPIGERDGAIAVALGLANHHDIVVIAGATPEAIDRETEWVELLLTQREHAERLRRAA
ncbi:MAG: cyanophycin synthetase [Planctomycetota bacterium]